MDTTDHFHHGEPHLNLGFGTFDDSTHPALEHENGSSRSYKQANLSTLRFHCIMATLSCLFFLSGLDGTITTTLTLPLMKEFESSILLSWTGPAYFIAGACVQPLCGQGADVFSRKTTSVISIAIFAAGNALIAVAPGPTLLILGRAVAGVGAGAAGTIAAIIVTDMVPRSRRGFWQGVLNTAFGAGHGLGGFFGGLMDETFHWRLAFSAHVPLLLIVAAVLLITIPSRRQGLWTAHMPIPEDGSWTLDLPGAGMVMTGLCCTLVALNQAAFSSDGLQDSNMLAILGLGLITLALFIVHALYLTSNPVLPIKSLAQPTTAAICFTSALTSAGYTSLEYLLPLLFQLQDSSIASSGLRLIPISVGGALGSIAMGVWLRSQTAHSQHSLLPLQVLSAAAILAFYASLTSSQYYTALIGFTLGFGYAGSLTTTLVQLVQALPSTQVATVTSLSFTCRHAGSAFGVAIASAIFHYDLLHTLSYRLPNVAVDHIEALARDPGLRSGLGAETAQQVLACYNDALHAALTYASGSCIAGLAIYVVLAFWGHIRKDH